MGWASLGSCKVLRVVVLLKDIRTDMQVVLLKEDIDRQEFLHRRVFHYLEFQGIKDIAPQVLFPEYIVQVCLVSLDDLVPVQVLVVDSDRFESGMLLQDLLGNQDLQVIL